MKKIVTLNSISKQYLNLQNQVKDNYKLIDGVKLLVTILFFIFTLCIYGYFVNISSTKGYFLREEMKKLDDAKFEQSIVQIDILKKERQVWDNINTGRKYNQIKANIDNKVVYLNYNR